MPSPSFATEVPGIVRVDTAPLARRELATSWQLGIAAGAGGGMIHAPSLMAPLVRHDRVYDHDQTVVTVWDLAPWEAPDELPRTQVLWHRAMLKRAVKHADAVVVPTHAHAEALRVIAPKLGSDCASWRGHRRRDSGCRRMRSDADARRICRRSTC